MTKRLLVLILALVMAVAACGGGDSDDGGSSSDSGGDDVAAASGPDADNGKSVFDRVCVACHGPGGEGIEGLGKPMPGSEFIAGLDDPGLIDFIKTGREVDDPLNTTGVLMPANGAQDLTDDEVADVVAYIRTFG